MGRILALGALMADRWLLGRNLVSLQPGKYLPEIFPDSDSYRCVKDAHQRDLVRASYISIDKYLRKVLMEGSRHEPGFVPGITRPPVLLCPAQDERGTTACRAIDACRLGSVLCFLSLRTCESSLASESQMAGWSWLLPQPSLEAAEAPQTIRLPRRRRDR
jgi:hypothetical protein